MTCKWRRTRKLLLGAGSPAGRALSFDRRCLGWRGSCQDIADHEGQCGHENSLDLHVAELFRVEAVTAKVND